VTTIIPAGGRTDGRAWDYMPPLAAILLQSDRLAKIDGKLLRSRCASTQVASVRSMTDTWTVQATLDLKLRNAEDEGPGSSPASWRSWESRWPWSHGGLPCLRERYAPW
jgi:hypothetical protein